MVQCIEHVSEIATSSPPGQDGVVDRLLIDRSFNGAFEMTLREIEPGVVLVSSARQREYQCFFVLDGEAEVEFGGDATRHCGPGAVIRIPPGLRHEVRCAGPQKLRLIVIHSPPLSPGEAPR